MPERHAGGSFPLRLELAEGEPTEGGFDFDAALRELVSAAEWQAYRNKDGEELIDYLPGFEPGTSEDQKILRIEIAYRKEVLEEKWRARKMVCFGCPRHKRTGRREIISPALLEDHLTFRGRGAATWKWEESEGASGAAYSEVLFYLGSEQAPGSGGKIPYGDKTHEVLAVIKAHREALEALRGQGARAQWIVARVRKCSPSLIKQLLRQEGL